MKKVSVVLALLLALTAAGCAPAMQSQQGDGFAVKSSLALTQTMGKLTDSSEYLKLFTSSDTILSEAAALSRSVAWFAGSAAQGWCVPLTAEALWTLGMEPFRDLSC